MCVRGFVVGRFPDRRQVLLFGAILLLAIVLRYASFSLFDTMHHDEILQYQERAYRMVTGQGIVPWETRYGLRNALIPDLLAGIMALASLFSTDHWVPLISARIVFAGFCLMAVPAAYAIGSVRSPAHGFVAMFVAAVWYEAVLFGVHVLSESISLGFAAAGTAALLRARESRRAALLSGFLLTMAVLLRAQYVVFAATLVLLTARWDVTLWRRLVIGGLPALAIGVITDLAAGIAPFSWVVANFTMNAIEGRAASFGGQGADFYPKAILVQLDPVAIAILIGALWGGRRYPAILAAAIVTIAAHSLIEHKEYRFIWLPVFMLLILAAIASADLANRLAGDTATPRRRAWAIGGMCLVWSAASLWSYSLGKDRPSLEGTGRDGALLARVAIRAAEMPGTCGIGTAIEERRSIAKVFMPRPVELYLFSDRSNRGQQTFAPELTAGADVLVVTRGGRPPPPYRRIACQHERDRNICLYRREGGCDPGVARRYTYQALLLANDH